MKRLIAGLMLAGTLLVSGCGGTVGGQATDAQRSATEATTTQPAPTTTQAPEPTATQSQADAIRRLKLLAPSFAIETDEAIVELFDGMCSAFDRGEDIDFVATAGLEAGYSPEDIGSAIGAAVSSTCPEYIPLLEQFIEDNAPPS